VGKARRDRGITSIYVDWDNQPLGDVTDAEIARRLGVDPSTVGKARRSRGIKAKRPYRKTDWNKEPLGKISDSDIARALSVSQPSVTRARNLRGIPPFRGETED
jgi:Mn-dependent DtxR family transcriptional regulator